MSSLVTMKGEKTSRSLNLTVKDEVAVSQIVYQTADSQIVYEETEEFLGPAMPSFDIFVEVLGRYFQDIYKT